MLYLTKSVWDNIAFGLRLKRLSAPEIQSRVEQALKLVKMEAMLMLSGGAATTGGIGASAGESPSVVLLDEPWAHSI